jgi:uncharacterized protein
VSGINRSLAKKIVKYRDEKGKIASREELTAVPGMGPKSYEQCAGFLKIPESADPLDNTWVHPENYEVARVIQQRLGGGTITVTGNLPESETESLKERYGVGNTTISDIMEELRKPNRDPRDGYPKPVMQKGVVSFEDLHEGMMITGKIKNVVDFGAFVDLGIKETALVHVSEMSDRFVKNPLEAVKVGDVLEFRVISLDRERRRIGLSRKSGQGTESRGQEAGRQEQRGGPPEKRRTAGAGKAGAPAGPASAEQLAERSGGKGSAPERTPAGRNGRPERRPPYGDRPRQDNRSRSDDDGTMYNPFAEVFKKMREKR